MIRLLKNYLETRKIKKTFDKLVSPSVVDSILKENLNPHHGELNERKLSIVWVLVRGSTNNAVAEHIRDVMDLAKEYGTGRDAITGSLLVFCNGRHSREEVSPERQTAFVASVCAKLGKDVRIVYGSGVGHVGLMGSDSFWAYSFLIPKFCDAMRILTNLQDGESKEISFS